MPPRNPRVLRVSALNRIPNHLRALAGGALYQEDLFHIVDLLELDFDDLGVGGLHHAADELRLDGQLPVPAVDQNQELDARRAAVIEESVERRADRPAGV